MVCSTLRDCDVAPLLICDNPISSSLSLKRYVLVSVARCYCVGVVERVCFVPDCNYCILFDVCCVLTVHNVLYKFV